MSETWDNLIVLDACRLDFFERVNILRGNLRRIWSAASTTLEWLKLNFPDHYPHVIYVSGNPHVGASEVEGFRGIEHFGYVDQVWKYGWHKKKGTVLPGTMVEAAIRAQRNFPGFKKIIHFIQPHPPFVGRIGFEFGGMWRPDKETKVMSLGTAITEGLEVDFDALRSAYLANLTYVLDFAEELCNELTGKTILTADHGELLGEYGMAGHYRGVYLRELCEVPWFVLA